MFFCVCEEIREEGQTSTVTCFVLVFPHADKRDHQMDVSVGIVSVVHVSVVHTVCVWCICRLCVCLQGFAGLQCISVCVGCCCKCNDIVMA